MSDKKPEPSAEPSADEAGLPCGHPASYAFMLRDKECCMECAQKGLAFLKSVNERAESSADEFKHFDTAEKAIDWLKETSADEDVATLIEGQGGDMALSHPRREALGRIITRLEGSAESIFRLSARLERMTFNRDLWLKNWRKSEDELTKTEARLKEAEAEVADLKRVLEVVRGQRRGLEAEVVRLKEKDARLQGRLDEVTHTGMKFEDDAKRLRRERDEAERKVKEFADVHGDICMTIARNSEREGMLRAAAAIRAEAAKLREGE